MTRVKNTGLGILIMPTIFVAVLLYFPLAASGGEAMPATDGKTMILYPTSRFITLSAVCFRQPECEQEVISLLKNTPGISNVMSYARQGSIMADFERGKVKPEDIAQKVLKLMEEKGFGKYQLKITGSRTIPNKLTVRLFPTRVMASSERFA